MLAVLMALSSLSVAGTDNAATDAEYRLKASLPPVYFHKANMPCPADGAVNVPIAGLQFAWLGGQGGCLAVTHDFAAFRG